MSGMGMNLKAGEKEGGKKTRTISSPQFASPNSDLQQRAQKSKV